MMGAMSDDMERAGRSTGPQDEAVRSFSELRRRRHQRTVTVVSATLLIVALVGSWAAHTLLTDVFRVGRQPVGGQDWNLTLVNRWNPIPEDYGTPPLTTLNNGQRIDGRILDNLQTMFDAMRAQGLSPEVTAGYRTRGEQQQIMDDKVAELRGQGMPRRSAEREAGRWVAEPGTSEHELGLAVDVNAVNHNDAQANQNVYDWLAAHAWEHGFILRYTDAKAKTTGTAGEAWHYRYVGAEAAKSMQESGQCLEEYLKDR